VDDALRSGDYARKQIYCPSRVVRWSHGSRFRLAARLAADAGAGGRLLDYGCGDGTFLALTHGVFTEAVGTDIDGGQLADCRRRLAGLVGLVFIDAAQIEADEHRGRYDVVTCMEVLEHCLDIERARVLRVLRQTVKPGRQVIISVPIEVGPALVGKQMFRALAARRGHGDYQHRETYSLRELAAAAFGRSTLPRAEYDIETPRGRRRYCGHKGFDWRILQKEIETDFTIWRRLFTPLPAFGGLMNSQVWFVCTAA
jgi:2-polyprenyl-3-methyl-5-hydroxy-6-metoxy-1,4-benzoquinol methylase